MGLTFAEFVDKVTVCVGDRACRAWNRRVNQKGSFPVEGLHSKTNTHWRPQILIANLRFYLSFHSFVGNFSHLRNDTETLLRSLGLWEEYGSNGWGGKKYHRMSKVYTKTMSKRGKEVQRSTNADEHASGEIFENNLAPHSTSASKKETFWDFYTPEMVARVKDAYRVDYALFDLLGMTSSIRPPTGEKFANMTVTDLDSRF